MGYTTTDMSARQHLEMARTTRQSWHGITRITRKIVLLICVAVTTVAQCEGEILTRGDRFLGAPDGVKMQMMVDDAGWNWTRPASHTSMKLLTNDALLLDSYSSCRETGSTFVRRNGGSGTAGSMAFTEAAENVGFTHVHRQQRPARGTCNFDQIVYTRFRDGVVKLKNELCTMEMLTGGTAVGDYDGDGFEDIFFTVYEDRSRLYRNKGDGTFEDVTASANVGPLLYGNGAGWIDVDGDGDLDLLVTTIGDSRYYLYINYGGHFREEARERNVSMEHIRPGGKLSGTTPSFGDFDNDGYTDIYLPEWIYHYNTGGRRSASRLLRNRGAEKPGHFEDVTDAAGVNMEGYWRTFRNRMGSGVHTFGASFTDFDNDGWLDLYVTGDFWQSKMFWNNGDGTFTECTKSCGIIAMNDAMGLSVADINNDGLMDIFVTAIHYTNTSCKLFSCKFGSIGNAFYLNKGNRTFQDITDTLGVRNGHWGWGAAMFDYDNDGFLDIVATNGMDSGSTTLDDEYGWKNVQLFRNQGSGKGNRMVDVAKESGIEFSGLGRGLLVFDFDNDGDQDVVVAANVGRPQFWINNNNNNNNNNNKNKNNNNNNNNNSNNWITVNVMHACPANNSKLCTSLGARVTITTNTSAKQISIIGSTTHFLGQSENRAHFGLGSYSGPVDVDVSWPVTGRRSIIKDVPLNRFLKVVEPEEDDFEEELDFQDLDECPGLYIDSISVQPVAGLVKVNSDQLSVTYLPGRLTFFDLDIQEFEYKVKVRGGPKGEPLGTHREIVRIDFRMTPADILYPKCSGGEQIGRKHRVLTTEQRFDGKSNNLKHVLWGAAQENLISISPLAYGDNVSDPSSSCTSRDRIRKECPFPKELGGVGSHRPSPRLISNVLMAQKEDVLSRRNLSDIISHFGQFLSHDTDHTSELPRFEFEYHHNHVWMPINIPKGDTHFDPYSTGKEKMAFIRSEFNRCTSGYSKRVERKQENKITAFIDANMVYGIYPKRCRHLRTYENGELRLSENGMLPKNKDYLANGNPTSQPARKLFVAGDVRSNTQPGLVVMHTLWVREHNRLARKYRAQHPHASDEETFLKARRLLISSMQYITYNEYLPAILGGKHHIPPYRGYNDSVDPSIATEFATAAFRFGHSQVNRMIFRLEENGNIGKFGHALLREVYFKPNRVEEEGGIDPILRGSVAFRAQEVDLLMVDEMRNHLFPTSSDKKKNTGFDLASLNIQRGRDHGLADLNTVRRDLGLKVYRSFDQITSDRKIAGLLKELYSNLDNIDLWIGGLAEDHLPNSELGSTFHALIVEQFTRLRDGDRFWYQNNLTAEEIRSVESLTFGEMIRLNTGFKSCPDNVFFSSRRCSDVINGSTCVPIPCRECELADERLKLRAAVNQQKSTVRWLTISLGVLAAVCIFLLIGVMLIRNGTNGKAGYIVSHVSNPITFQVKKTDKRFKDSKNDPHKGILK